MAVENNVTLSGNLTADPTSGVSRNGDAWAKLRLASTTRVFDRGQNQWRDGDTVFIDVSCWRKLAEHVTATLERGDAVLVAGRVHQHTYDDVEKVRRTVTTIVADCVGPDLNRCPALLVRPPRSHPADEPEPVADEAALEVSAP